MIFVTVGTAFYDPLICQIDSLVEQGLITDPVVAQIGRGQYIPKNFSYFRFLRNLDRAYSLAEVIVSTGGAGTTMECVTKGLKLVVVENTSLAEGHQAQLIGEMERRGHLIWCKDLKSIRSDIESAKNTVFQPFKSDPPLIHKYIIKLLSTR
ncbi:MAG: glycosyltransferase [Candidatus Thorarchaeota archaeon]